MYDASYFSISDENNNGQDPVASLVEISKGKDEDAHTKVGENKGLAIALPDIHFLYGQGTMLTTITEQKSNLTMRSLARTKSVDHLCQTKSLTHQDSFCISRVPRRKQSFSFDDVALIKLSYHEACSKIEGSPAPSIHEVYAQPKAPLHAPIARPGTPPGMPSWSDGQVLTPPRRAANQAHPGGFRRWLGLSNSPSPLSAVSSCNSQAPVILGRVPGMGGRIAPRFRPPRSAYATINEHPFMSAPLARVPTHSLAMPSSRRKRLVQRVRFTPSATARDSELDLLRTAIENTSASAVNPMEAIPMPEHSETQITCPHRSGRRAALRRLQAASTPQPPVLEGPQEFVVTPTSLRAVTPSGSRQSPERQNSIPSIPSALNPSTENLMSNNTPNTTEGERKTWCWKCKLERVLEACDRVWMGSLNCFCFVCCGFDLDDCGHGRGGGWVGARGREGNDGREGWFGGYGGRDFRGNGGGQRGYRIPSAGFTFLDGASSPELRGPRRVLLGRRVGSSVEGGV